MNELRKDETLRTTDVLDPEIDSRDIDRRDESLRRDASFRDERLSNESLRNDGVRSASDESRGALAGTPVERIAPVAPGDPDRRDLDRPGMQPVDRATTLTQESRSPVAPREKAASGLLFPEDELHHFRARWDQVQASFVDEPRHAVEAADTLVTNVVKRIAEQFAEERTRLEGQWERGENVSTEDLRQGFRRYRFLFDRLLTLQPDASDTAETSRPVMAGR